MCDLERDATNYDGSGGDTGINVTPAEINLQLPPDEITSVALAICNNGTGDLEYNVSVSYMATATATDCDVTATSKAALRPEGIKTQVGAIATIAATASASEIAISVDKEIGYDDGEADGAYYWDTAGCGAAVHFTSLDYDTLKTARFYLEINESVPDNSFNWKVLGWTGSKPGSEIGSGIATPVSDGWYDSDLGGITVPDGFVIAMYWRQGGAPSIGYDSDPPIGRRSWDYTDGWLPWHAEDYMIRAVMDTGWEWLSVNRENGMIESGRCDEIIVTVDATGLDYGDYSAKITIDSNDQNENPVTVPVTLTMGDKHMEGDANGDGCVSLKDSTAIKQYLVDEKDLNKSQLKCADTLDDGEVNLKDSTLIRKWLVDPSTPLWKSPADANMAKPETC